MFHPCLTLPPLSQTSDLSRFCSHSSLVLRSFDTLSPFPSKSILSPLLVASSFRHLALSLPRLRLHLREAALPLTMVLATCFRDSGLSVREKSRVPRLFLAVVLFSDSSGDSLLTFVFSPFFRHFLARHEWRKKCQLKRKWPICSTCGLPSSFSFCRFSFDVLPLSFLLTPISLLELLLPLLVIASTAPFRPRLSFPSAPTFFFLIFHSVLGENSETHHDSVEIDCDSSSSELKMEMKKEGASFCR